MRGDTDACDAVHGPLLCLDEITAAIVLSMDQETVQNLVKQPHTSKERPTIQPMGFTQLFGILASAMPTGEPVLVEIVGDGAGGNNDALLTTVATSIMSAVIAAVVAFGVGRQNHSYNQNREHQAWLRERMFDVCKRLTHHYRVIRMGCSECVDVAREHRDGGTPGAVGLWVETTGWSELESAIDGYTGALDEGRLLARSQSLHSVMSRLSGLTKGIDPAKIYTFHSGFEDSDNLVSAFHDSLSNTVGFLDDLHTSLMNQINEIYFPPDPVQQSKKAWWRIASVRAKKWWEMWRSALHTQWIKFRSRLH